MKDIYVSRNTADKEGSFPTLSAALESIKSSESEPVYIHILPGRYYEKIEIKRSNLIIEGTGEKPEDTELTFDDYARMDMPDGSKRGTFRSYSMFIDANNVTLRNLTVSNNSGPENECWQAIALYADGDNLKFENIRLIGKQDTLFTGPLPPKEIQPGGFVGPKQFAPRINGRQYYKNCLIRGNVDFIFGSATAYFEDCTIESIKRSIYASSDQKDQNKEEIHGYTTASSTPEGQKYGYVFRDCDFISDDCPENSVYLARPWRDYAKSIFIDCTFGNHITPEGFHDWGKENARLNSFFSTIGCYRPDGTAYHPTAEFARFIGELDLDEYSIENVLKEP